MKKDWCVTKNNKMWADFLYEEDALEIQTAQQEADRAGHVWVARKMTTKELGEGDE
jgi:hypothetical protein